MDAETEMKNLRGKVKRSLYRYSDIASRAGVSSEWVGTVLRGNYPHYCGFKIPKNIRKALEDCGFDVSEILITF